MASLALVFDILAKDNASSTFKQVGDEAERTGKKAESGLGSIVSAAKVAGAAILGAGIISGFRELYDAAAESARIARLTENAIRSTGGAAKITAGQVGDLAAAISNKTGVDDEAIQSGQNLLLTFTNIRNEVGEGNDIFNQASQTLVDMSTVLGTDASGSAVQLGKALNDPIKGITALSRAGVSFTAEQKEQIRTLQESGDTLGAQKIILAELTKEFGGAAAAAATPLDKLKVSVGNIAETVGAYLIPVVDDFATKGLTAIEGVAEGFESGEVSADGFEGAMQGVGAVVGQVADVAGALVGAVGDVAGFFTDLPGPVQAGVAALAGFVLLKGPVSEAFETIALKALYARDNVVAAGTGMAGLKGAASGVVGFLGGPWGIAIGAATVGLGFLTQALGDSDESAEKAETAQRAFADAVKESNGVIDDNVRSAAAKAAQDAGLLDTAEALGLSTEDVTAALLGNTGAYDDLVTAANAYYDASLQSENAGDLGMTENAERVRGFVDGLNELAPTVRETAEEQRQLDQATGGVNTALAGATPVASAFENEMEGVKDELKEAKDAADAYKLSLDVLTGTSITALEAENAYYAAIDAASLNLDELEGSVANAAGGLNTQTEAGRTASDALLDLRDSGNQLISTLIEQGGTLEDVTARDAQLRDSFIDTAEQMGFSQDQARGLADQILGIPAERTTTIQADVSEASGVLSAFQEQINQIARDRSATINLRATLPDLNGTVSGSGRPGAATGGYITGPGTGTSDDIPIQVSNGEYVIRAAQVDKYGVGFFDALNEGALRPTGPDARFFADGGLVSIMGKAVSSAADINRQIDRQASAVLSQVDAASSASGGGAANLTGTWTSIWNYVKSRIPQARINSTYRAGDPGYHGRNKAIDFGFGSGPGGAGSAGLASINRLLFDTAGANLAELIYDGIGDDRSDIKNGRPHTYAAGTRNEHRNHVHAATYDDGGILQPGYTLAFNGTGKGETIRTAEQESSLGGGSFVGELYLDSGEFLGMVRGVARQESVASIDQLRRTVNARA